MWGVPTDRLVDGGHSSRQGRLGALSGRRQSELPPPRACRFRSLGLACLDGHLLLDGGLDLVDVVDGGLGGGRVLHHDLAHPSGHAILHAGDLGPRLHQRPHVQHVLHYVVLVQEADVGEHARALRVHRELGEVGEGRGRDGGPGRDARGQQQLLLHQVHAPDQEVHVPHGAPAHAAVDLDQARAARGVLALHVEHAHVEAQGLDRCHAQLQQLALLRAGQDGGRVGPGLVEVRLQRGPVVGDRAVHGLPLAEHHVHVHLRAVQVLLHHQRGGEVALPLVVRRHLLHDPRVHAHGAHLAPHARVGAQERLVVVHAHNAERGRAVDGLDDRRVAHQLGSGVQLVLARDQEVARRRQPRLGHAAAGGVLVACGVHRCAGVAGQAQLLDQPRHQRLGHLREGHHAVQLAKILLRRRGEGGGGW
ncbi:hypothetical protein F751_4579 [Auxenochlorella protothecoides]|uniref:Uncharacterized protein n=1 Tax=Auxenochlorella protothecoides TaxID=3075 RepID=A0A087SNK5_AUXPR|nr:hypothetical protein F751_4579 [Auxenochlorella protothecoides]KFM27309.1 hypothetical protein F751_4579 [Auxenochlorella protothecoides]